MVIRNSTRIRTQEGFFSVEDCSGERLSSFESFGEEFGSPSTFTSTILLRVSLDKKGCTSTIQASLIVFDLHFLCTICRICYKVLYYGNRTVQWRCPSALLPSGTGNRNVSYIFSLWQSSSKLAMLIVYRKCSKSSLLYINQCLKFSSKVTPFKIEPKFECLQIDFITTIDIKSKTNPTHIFSNRKNKLVFSCMSNEKI